MVVLAPEDAKDHKTENRPEDTVSQAFDGDLDRALLRGDVSRSGA